MRFLAAISSGNGSLGALVHHSTCTRWSPDVAASPSQTTSCASRGQCPSRKGRAWRSMAQLDEVGEATPHDAVARGHHASFPLLGVEHDPPRGVHTSRPDWQARSET